MSRPAIALTAAALVVALWIFFGFGQTGIVLAMVVAVASAAWLKRRDERRQQEHAAGERRIFALERQLAELAARVDALAVSPAPGASDLPAAGGLPPAAARAEDPMNTPDLDAMLATPELSQSAPVNDTMPTAAAAARPRPALDLEVITQTALWRWFFGAPAEGGGNALARIGVVILFFGVAFLLKYAADHTTLPMWLRLAGVAAGGLAMIAFGERLHGHRAAYAIVLQGGGIGVVYLTTFAATRIFAVLPPVAALVIMLIVVAAGCLLALRRDAMPLALVASIGGFLAPVLVSTGQGSHVVLFAYYVILNAGILGLAWHKAWRQLNLVGFIFTFGIATVWGAQYYDDRYFASTEPFLVIFVAMYIAIAIAYALRRGVGLKDSVHGTLVFGTPLIAFALQARLVNTIEYGLAASALALAAIYLALAHLLNRRQPPQPAPRLLAQCFLAIGVAFATVAVPLVFNDHWIATTWAVEGAAMLWLALVQRRRLPAWAGLALQVLAAVALSITLALSRMGSGADTMPIINATFVSVMMVALAGLASAWLIERHHIAADDDGVIRPLLVWSHAQVPVFIWGALWLFIGVADEIGRFVRPPHDLPLQVIATSGLALALLRIGEALQWRLAREPAHLLVYVLVLAAAATYDNNAIPSDGYGWVAWPLAAASVVAGLHRLRSSLPAPLIDAALATAVVLFTLLAAWDASVQVTDLDWSFVTPAAAWAIVTASALAAICLKVRSSTWPMSANSTGIISWGGALLAGALGLWMLTAGLSDAGRPLPAMPYLPIINTSDLACCAALAALFAWGRVMMSDALPDPARWLPHSLYQGGLAVLGFAAFNAILLRAVHHWAGVPHSVYRMMNSTIAQATVSLAWAALGTVVMFSASRRGARQLWFVGAALLGVVVVKLFIVDLASLSGLTRIAAFIGVGVLVLAIGYLSPAPPGQQSAAPQ